ncbi:MAG: Gfo/Idh/MocA family oxidoreductase [Pseudomonadales bacterium]|nr:Gfo/Idh/MocA family oxidoreductase [Pseudomonadales bacterium]MBO6563919.1 Gfo/Idh/MocA family oxidoreductase [Pseudomonadales bacterium]MBO6594791.1 Gfo/Idh/MocA family oxidoreductase [Pseudomonadales bacterium]MBO6701296.1 Gfo/Idh/MocA family oxidoreductase [Pseudomonadales bacterium]MBO6821649.1 Gfo/Idh/MocA family oxidoreductase [Pseudomonadales bacterium]
MKFAVVGTGMMGCEHIRNLAHIPDVDLVAIADPNEKPRNWALKACGDRFSPKIVDDYRDLKSLDLDAVVIASPNFTHINVVRDLADTSFHLLLEKPMCTTLEDAREVIDLDDAREPMIWVALEYRYMSATTHFLNRIPEVGDLKMFFIREHRGPFLRKVDNWNRFNRNSGGTLVEKCCHFFDLMNLATGAHPVSAMASGNQDVNHLDETYDGERSDILDNAFTIINYDNGVRACLDLCMFAEGSPNEQELTATGSSGKLEVRIPNNQLSLSKRTGELEEYEVPHDPDIAFMGLHHGASYLEQKAFIHAIRTGKPPSVNTRDGFQSVAMGIAAQESIASGQPVAIQPL